MHITHSHHPHKLSKFKKTKSSTHKVHNTYLVAELAIVVDDVVKKELPQSLPDVEECRMLERLIIHLIIL